MYRRVRPLLRRLHLWAGVVLALPLAVTGTTGAVLVYGDALAPMVDGPAWAADVAGRPLAWPDLVRALKAHDPEARVAWIGGERGGERPLLAWLDHPSDGFKPMLVDPYSGTVTERRPGEEWLTSIETLHRNLLLGGIGRQVVAVSSIAMAVVVVLGLVLWWPMRRGTFRRLTGRGGVLGWHNLLGLFAAPLLVLFALTGITLTYHGQVIPALYQLATGSGEPAEPTVAAVAEPVPLERVFAAARGAFAGARVQGFSEPDADDGAYRLRLRRADSVHPDGWLEVWVDPATGTVAGTRDTGSESWASWYDRFWFALHTGSFLPAGPRALWLLAAASLPVLGATGVWQWLRRRRQRRSARLAFAVAEHP